MEALQASAMRSPSGSAPPVVSVIVPAHNAARRLPPLLDALSAQTVDRGLFEVIVVDDGSTDDTAAVVTAREGAHLVRAPARRGSYAARNLAIREARGSVLAFIDTDCTPARTWIERGLSALESTDIVAGHVEIPLGDSPSAAAILDVARRHIDQAFRVSNYGFGATANLWLRRELMERVGYFREDLISGGDSEFGRRATAAGASLAYASDVAVTHPPRGEAMDLLRKQLRLGFGAAQRRQRPDSSADVPPRIWSRARHYVPRATIYGADELERRGYRLSLHKQVSVRVLQYFCCQLPLALGNLAGTIACRLPSRLRR